MRGSLILLILIICGCTKKEDFSSVSVIGHAGMGLNIENSIYHDNSQEAIELALSIEGSNGVEVDVHLSQDNQLWLYHDNELSSQTNGEGCISGSNSSLIKDLTYTSFHSEKLIKLKDLNLKFLKGKNLFLDVRHMNTCSDSLLDENLIIQAILDLPFIVNPEVTIFCILPKKQWIEPFETAGLNVLLSVAENQDPSALLAVYPQLSGVVLKNSASTKELVDQIHALEKKVFIFEMRSPKGIRAALKKYPDGVITDDIRSTLIEKF